MTWKQFKDAVEAAGIKDEDGIFLIETGEWPQIEDVGIFADHASDLVGRVTRKLRVYRKK